MQKKLGGCLAVVFAIACAHAEPEPEPPPPPEPLEGCAFEHVVTVGTVFKCERLIGFHVPAKGGVSPERVLRNTAQALLVEEDVSLETRMRQKELGGRSFPALEYVRTFPGPLGRRQSLKGLLVLVEGKEGRVALGCSEVPSRGFESPRCDAVFSHLLERGLPERARSAAEERVEAEGPVVVAGHRLRVPEGCELQPGNRLRCRSGLLHWTFGSRRDGAHIEALYQDFRPALARLGELEEEPVFCRVFEEEASCLDIVLQSPELGVVDILLGARLVGDRPLILQCTRPRGRGDEPAELPEVCRQAIDYGPEP